MNKAKTREQFRMLVAKMPALPTTFLAAPATSPDGIPPLPPRGKDRPLNDYRCKFCGGKGHNRRTCPDLGKQRAERHKKP